MDFAFEDPQTRLLVRRVHELSDDLKLIAQLRAPSIRDIAAAPLLDDWFIGHRMEPALVGTVSGHPVVPDGPAVTSGLYVLDPVAGYARTLSRWWRLGQPKI